MKPRLTLLLILTLTALLTTTAGCLFDTDPSNSPPVIDTLEAAPPRIAPNSTSTVSVQAHDPEGVPLDYRWTATAGWFESGSYEASAVWRAPATIGPCTLTVTVDDGRDEVVGTLVIYLIQLWSYEIIARYPHDTDAFTQGLAWHDGALYEGTGRYGYSRLREVDLTTGDVVREVALDGSYFGEGITVWQDRVIQLTWQNNTALIWALGDFAPLGTFTYPTQGWGLTHDDTRLIMSDGTATLYFRDPDTFAETGRVTITVFGTAQNNLNELEWINGKIWANIWLTDYIVGIDPTTGEVTDIIDFAGLLESAKQTSPSVLNGIAHDPDTGRTWVTGKYWPWLFEIELVDPTTR